MQNIKKYKKNQMPIGVFDSGVGGLSILRELKKMLPNEDFVFLADQFYVPYGEKNKKELIRRVYKITDYFIKHHNIKMMVVACNTATCGAINELRKKYSFPIVGTVPAVKVAAEKTKNGTMAVISTPSTSKSVMLKNLIKENCRDINVLNVGCKNLEDVVEEGDLNSTKVEKLLQKYLKDIKSSNTVCLVLGCTHYPFLKQIIQKMVGPRVHLIDSGQAIAKHTKFLLLNKNIKNKQKKKGKIMYFTTGSSVKFSKVAGKLLKNKIKTRKVAI